MNEPADHLKKKLENQGEGNGRPPRPTAVGMYGFGYDGLTPLPDIASLKRHKGVIGSLIIGHDGELQANDLPDSYIDPLSLGVGALAVYMNTSHVMKKIGQNKCHEIVSKTSKGYSLIAECYAGLLVTITEAEDTALLIPLMRGITKIISAPS